MEQERYLERVAHIGSRALCLVTATFKRIWQNGSCYNERFRDVIVRRVEQELDSYNLDPYSLNLGPVFVHDEAAKTVLVGALAVPVYE